MKFHPKKVAAALAHVMGGTALIVGTPADAQDIVRYVTGSSLPRTEVEGSIPVQTITAEDIARTGTITVQDLLLLISANQSLGANVPASVIGPTTLGQNNASLRGLGGQRTLVLINGKRQATFSGGIRAVEGVNLTAIPTSAIERVEVLLDGASAIYGSDAIGGVINFILRQDYSGFEATGYYGVPTRSGGGDQWNGKASAGWGDLAKDGWSVFASGFYTKQKSLMDIDRDFAKTSYIPQENVFTISSNTFPAMIASGDYASVGYPNCNSPYASINDPDLLGPQCYYDPSLQAQAKPDVTQYGGYLSGNFRMNSQWQAYATGSYTKQKNLWIIQPNPVSNIFPLPPNNPVYSQYGGYQTITLPPGSPYYPTEAAAAAGVPGEPLNLRYRDVEAGNRNVTDTVEQYSAVGGVKGNWKNWDLDFDGYYNVSKATESINSGYYYLSQRLALLNSGQVNMFGPNTPDIVAALQATEFTGDTFSATSKLYGVEGKGSTIDILNLPAGPLAMALGASWHREELEQSWNPAMQTGDISGYGGNFFDVNQSRDAWAVYGELGIPIVKSFEGTVAVRYDHYSDFGGTTNPKFTLRWQPLKELLLRGSYGTGFLAPSLYELYVPDNNSVTVAGLSDPIRCPVTRNVGIDCDTQFQDTFGGNRTLKPETSFQINAGIVVEPARGLSLTVDWFKINLANQITNGPSPSYILEPANYDQYAYLVERAAPDAQYPDLPGRITNIIQRYVNQGSIHIVGLDASLKYVFPKAEVGQFTFNMNGTYFSKYDYQLPNGTYAGQVANAGAPGISSAGVVPRWKHYAQLNWNLGPWSATLGNTYQTGYIDQYTDLAGNVRRVSDMSLWDLQFDYTGFRNWKLSLGAKNLMDTNPPFTNQSWQFQQGYDPSYYDPNARFIYASVTYSFGH